MKPYPLKVYNTRHKQKELFEPITPGYVGMYNCGPTVYGDPHLGHARSAIFVDVLYRYLQHLGYKVRYVRNITDVGHLEDELAGAGEDKISKKARLEQLEPMEVVQHYTVSYRKAMADLNCLSPSIEPVASGHIIEQIEITQKILAEGLAYESEGSVYLDIEKYASKHPYGQLSGKVLEDLRSGSRSLDGQDEKRSPLDFALWKKAKPEHIMKWPSPWGEGFPGWHLECTAMSSKYLGVPFDIHCGGLDLQFPHHEGEIAQCCSAFGQEPVKYWMHNNMLTLEGQKMSKSKGNFINLEEMFSGAHDLLEQAYTPMTIRFFMLQAHYGSPLDFGNEPLKAAEKGYKRMMQALKELENMEAPKGSTGSQAISKRIDDNIASFYASMGDDLNTAKASASLFDMVALINDLKSGKTSMKDLSTESFTLLKENFTSFVLDVFGLKPEAEDNNSTLDGVVSILIKLRQEAKEKRDYLLADQIRDELKDAGVSLRDSKDGTDYVLQ